ncbi:MAG: SDR family NAD(P)-dependent oxidoreductase [Rhodoglobus sp.]
MRRALVAGGVSGLGAACTTRRIINMASMAGKNSNPNLSRYSPSKAAVFGLGRATY